METSLLLDIIFMLIAAVIAVPLSRAAGLGAVPGFVLAGLIVGPSGLALIDNADAIGYLSELGVVLLLFLVGIELKPARLWLMRRSVFGLGLIQVVVTGLAITAVCLWLFEIPLRPAILIGPALALSSTAFVLQLLSERNALGAEHGRLALSVLLFQDLAVVPLLALISLLAVPEMTIGLDIAVAVLESIAILAVVILFGRLLLQPIFRHIANFNTPELFTAFAVLLVLGAAVLTEKANLSMAMGAFLAGVLIADSPYRHQVVAEVQPFRGLFLGLFFMSMGMALNLSEFFVHPLTSIALVGAMMLLKVLILFPATFLFGSTRSAASGVALLLAQSGEFGLVLFSVANRSGIVSDGLFQDLLLIVLLSMLATPPVAYLAHRLTTESGSASADEPPTPENEPPPVIIAGFGRFGSRIGDLLESAGMPFAAIDKNVALVERARQRVRRVYYGDAGTADTHDPS